MKAANRGVGWMNSKPLSRETQDDESLTASKVSTGDKSTGEALAVRVHGPKPPTPQRVSIEALLDGQCGYAVVRSRKSLSRQEIFRDLTLSVCAVSPRDIDPPPMRGPDSAV